MPHPRTHTHPPWRSKCATVHRHALHTHNPCTTLDSQNRSRRITDRRQKKEERIRRSSPGCVSTLLWWSLSLYAGGSPLTSSSIDWRLPPSMSLAFCCCSMSISSSSAVQIAERRPLRRVLMPAGLEHLGDRTLGPLGGDRRPLRLARDGKGGLHRHCERGEGCGSV